MPVGLSVCPCVNVLSILSRRSSISKHNLLLGHITLIMMILRPKNLKSNWGKCTYNMGSPFDLRICKCLGALLVAPKISTVLGDTTSGAQEVSYAWRHGLW